MSKEEIKILQAFLPVTKAQSGVTKTYRMKFKLEIHETENPPHTKQNKQKQNINPSKFKD